MSACHLIIAANTFRVDVRFGEAAIVAWMVQRRKAAVGAPSEGILWATVRKTRYEHMASACAPMRDMWPRNFGVVLKRIVRRRIFEWLFGRMIDS